MEFMGNKSIFVSGGGQTSLHPLRVPLAGEGYDLHPRGQSFLMLRAKKKNIWGQMDTPHGVAPQTTKERTARKGTRS